MGFMPDLSGSIQQNLTSVEDTTVTLARMNLFIATALTCLNDDQFDKFGDRQYTLYPYTSCSFLPLTYDQLASIACGFSNE